MNSTPIADAVKDRLAILTGTPIDSIDDDTPVADLGIDSLGFLELISVMEAYLGHEVPARDLVDLRCIRDMEQYVTVRSSVAAAAPPAGPS